MTSTKVTLMMMIIMFYRAVFKEKNIYKVKDKLLMKQIKTCRN